MNSTNQSPSTQRPSEAAAAGGTGRNKSAHSLSRWMLLFAIVLLGVVGSFIFYQISDRSNQTNLRELVTRDVLRMGERMSDRIGYMGRDVVTLSQRMSESSSDQASVKIFRDGVSDILGEMPPSSALILIQLPSTGTSDSPIILDHEGAARLDQSIDESRIEGIVGQLKVKEQGILGGGVLVDVPMSESNNAHLMWFTSTTKPSADGKRMLLLALTEISSMVDATLSNQLSLSYDVLVGKTDGEGANRILTYRTASFRESTAIPNYDELKNRPTQQYLLTIGGDAISILFNPTVTWIEEHQSPLPHFLFVLALTVTTLVAILLVVLAKRTAVIENTVLERTSELAESERKLSVRNGTLNSILDRSPDVVILQNQDGSIIYANPKTYKVLSVDVARDIVDKLPSAVASMSCGITAMLMNTIGRGFHQIKDGDLSSHREISDVVDSYGREIFLDVLQVPVRNESGELIRVLTVARDTTEQHRQLGDIRAAHSRIEILVEKSATAIIEWNPNGEIASWNPAAESIFGFTANEAIGKESDFIRVTKASKTLPCPIGNPLSDLDSNFNRTWQNLTKGGRVIACEWQNTSLTDPEGRVIGVTSFVYDVTRRILAEHALHERDRVLGNLATSTVGFMRSEEWQPVAGKLLSSLISEESISKAALFQQAAQVTNPEYTTVIACELSQGSPMILDGTHGEMIAEANERLIHEPWLERLRDGEEIFGDKDQFDTRARDILDGEGVFSILVIPINVDGDLWGFLRFDHSDQAKPWTNDQVDALRIVGAVIATAITKHSLDTKQVGLERRLLLAQKRESLGLLASGVARNFKDLVDSILGSASLARTQVDSDTTVDDCLGSIENSGLRASELCREMLLYSGQSGNEVGLVSVNLILLDAISQIRHSASDSIQIVTDFANGLPVIEGDAGQLRQAVYNVLLNSTESMDSGTGLIRIQTGLVSESNSETEVQNVFIRITDTGTGIDERSLEHVFDPFFSTKAQGRGLGLTLVQSAVEAHGGHIRVKSELGHGTVITVHLPSRNKLDVKKNTARQNPLLQLNGSVLYAEANEEQRRVGSAILKKFGLKVDAVSDGKEALDRVTRHSDRYLFVILDMRMPVMDGLTALTRILKINREQRIILTSSKSFSSETHRLVDEGLAVTIANPIEEAELSGAIRELLGRYPIT